VSENISTAWTKRFEIKIKPLRTTSGHGLVANKAEQFKRKVILSNVICAKTCVCLKRNRLRLEQTGQKIFALRRNFLYGNNNLISSNSHKLTALDFLEGKQYLAIAIDSFLTDRMSRNRSPRTLKYYRNYLEAFEKYSNSQAVISIQDI